METPEVSQSLIIDKGSDIFWIFTKSGKYNIRITEKSYAWNKDFNSKPFKAIL